jgi:SAM-dependent MidA family methyltransferase
MRTSAYMQRCLFDPADGYYATRPGLGRDFATSPEISQVFGELIGAWAIQQWETLGRPSHVWLVEAGPGRGLMMADMLRVARTSRPFAAAMRPALIEISPVLRKVQAEKLAPVQPHFLNSLDEIDTGAVIIVANEWLDCLPVDQFVRRDGGWRERLVGRAPNGDLAWGLGPFVSRPEAAQPDADEFEDCPALDRLAADLADLLKRLSGCSLLIDYGSAEQAPGDTLRAYCRGCQIDPLAAPGESDLTADVDFGRLARRARAHGLGVHGPVPQGRFLLRLGAAERAQALAVANPDRAADVLAGVARLVDPSGLGERFQAIALTSGSMPPPPGFLETPTP